MIDDAKSPLARGETELLWLPLINEWKEHTTPKNDETLDRSFRDGRNLHVAFEQSRDSRKEWLNGQQRRRPLPSQHATRMHNDE